MVVLIVGKSIFDGRTVIADRLARCPRSSRAAALGSHRVGLRAKILQAALKRSYWTCSSRVAQYRPHPSFRSRGAASEALIGRRKRMKLMHSTRAFAAALVFSFAY